METIAVGNYRITGHWAEENNITLFVGSTDQGEKVRYRPYQTFDDDTSLDAALIFDDRMILDVSQPI